MRTFFTLLATVAALTAGVSQSAAAHTEKAVAYKDGTVELEGFAVIPARAALKKAPGILLVHDWTGVQEYSMKRARMLADNGYVAFCCDIYGKGIRPPGPPESSKQAGIYKADRELYRRRLVLGLDQLKSLPGVDTSNLAAIGYCFGGTGVLELARTGAEVKGVVSFHGGLDSTNPADGQKIKTRILVLHGADDPFVPKEGIEAMRKEFDAAKVDWQMISYSGAVHSFTNSGAGNDNSKGSAYNEKADQRSWQHMMVFFNELFPQ